MVQRAGPSGYLDHLVTHEIALEQSNGLGKGSNSEGNGAAKEAGQQLKPMFSKEENIRIIHYNNS